MCSEGVRKRTGRQATRLGIDLDREGRPICVRCSAAPSWGCARGRPQRGVMLTRSPILGSSLAPRRRLGPLCRWPACRRLCTPSGAPSGAPPSAFSRSLARQPSALARQPQQQHAASVVALHRRAERQRFGLPVLHLLGLGLLGGALVARAWLRSYDDAHPGRADGPARPLDVSLGSHDAVHTSAQAAALMEHVREVLSRHGLSLGDAHLTVRVH